MTLASLLAFASANSFLSFALLGLTLALIYTELSRLMVGYKSVNPAALTALINRENALLVDVSPAADFEKGHIAGARNVLVSQFDPENKLLAKAKELPVAVTCRNGVASSDAAKRLVKAGFQKVYWLDGGVAAWQQADLPLIKGKG
ncbi:MAG TPA: rhodanese-like domain-containing protein [Arenimonas sp.]|uniref:rhodanese-like domain-containing protein n=1 Tax=Arenimonas sp. TaxID=1872635 RepID=UPI002B75A4A8|nr:rhodanese-like domain-containing protein [Arenimonas sp.]HMB57135.1 rhodanese-like domain-containing protein [Arenimonas sp.]